ncbi:MAG: tRNA (adenine-N1)-methyltransferase [Acidimicrobiaceae bacterium]|nr:tRNA (adenine-N1)-methyltransferase [Acidimicrobiaceae bacterium]
MNNENKLLHEGELVLLVDHKDRRYLLTLETNSEFHSHSGFVSHNELIGKNDGVKIKSSGGLEYLVLRPTMSDVILKMPRSAQIIYPKDIGPILIAADIAPGHNVLESGVGSGALSIALLRAGANVTGIELREDFAQRARKNVEAFFAEELERDRYTVLIGDAYEKITGSGYDRMVLDLPEPWRVIDHVENCLRPGGIIVSYSPSITQVSQLTDRLDRDKFVMTETQEILLRSWHIEGRAVRPDHRMVAHTGFITSTRYLGNE